MIFRKHSVSALVGTLIGMAVLISCETEIEDTLGDGVIGGDPFVSDSETFDVFAFNRRVTAVQTNKIPLYQLGVYNDPVYGRREARITSQLTLPQLAGNPTFGTLSQEQEDNADTDDSDNTIDENETVTEVILYIPYQLVPATNRDRDADGVQDELDADPLDPNSDTDGDGVTDNQERVLGSNPLDPNEDGSGDNFVGNTFPIEFALDSIFSNTLRTDPTMDFTDVSFNLTVEQSTFFLRDLDPNTNFQEEQEFFSNTDITTFSGDVLAQNAEVTISNREFLTFMEEDGETEVMESNMVESRLNPGVRINLDTQFFQENILDMEGSTELLSQFNFNDFLRGLHFRLTPMNTEDLLILFDFSQANITIVYEYDDFVPGEDGAAGELVEDVEDEFVLGFLINNGTFINGNAVNTFIDEPFSPEIEDSLDNNTNASRIYLKGGSGVYTELQLFEEDNGTTVINQIRENNWIINEANLVFYVDQEAIGQNGTFEPPRLYLFDVETGQPVPDLITEISTPATLLGLGLLSFDGNLEQDDDNNGLRYTVRLTEYINDLVVRGEDNATLGLTLTSNAAITGTLDAQVTPGIDGENRAALPVMSTINPLGTVLFGSDVEPQNEDRRLRLEIFFTEAN